MFGRTRRAVRERVATAELPEPITRCIEEVARRTRLRCAEQLDVAAELASHFREGLAAGKDADALVLGFGDTKQSARAIRRASIAKRGAVDRLAGTLAVWSLRGFTAIAVWYFAWATMLHFKQPTISFDGRTVIESMRAKPGPEGRAVDLYIEVLGDPLGQFSAQSASDDLLAVEEAVERAAFESAAHDQARAALAKLAPRIEGLRGVRARPVFAMPLRPTRTDEPAVSEFFWGVDAPEFRRDAVLDEGLLGVLLPQLSVLRTVGRMLSVDAAIAAIDGRSDDFLADIETMLAASRHAGEDRFLISALVECAMRTMTARTVVSAIENHAGCFDDEELATMRAWMEANEVDISPSFDAEMLFVRDILQRIYTDDGDGDGVLLASAAYRWGRLAGLVDGATPSAGLLDAEGGAVSFVLSPAAALIAPSRAEVTAFMEQHYGRLRAASAMADVDAARAELASIDRELEQRKDALKPISLLIPALSKAAFVPRGLRGESDAAVAAIALEQFRRAEQRWPSDLAELERFAGRRFGGAGGAALAWRYAIVDGRPLIYDPGIDLIDDRARGPVEHRPEGVSLVALAAASGDGAMSLGAAGGATWRTAASIEPTAEPRPGCALPAEAASGSRDGDAVRVWWNSRACGPSRMVPQCESRE